MDSEQVLLEALHADPGDETAWLALADCLEENRQPVRAELLRLHRRLRTFEEGVERQQMEARVREMLAAGLQPCVPILVNSIGMKFALVPAGTFVMGLSLEAQNAAILARSRDQWERRMGPQHEVELTQSFYLGICQTTVSQFEDFAQSTGYRTEAERGSGAHRWYRWTGLDDSWALGATTSWRNPGFTQKARQPVTCVSWNDVQVFLRWLNELPAEQGFGRRYRLPTEAEWEYACRGGVSSSTLFHQGDSLSSSQANFDGNYPAGGAARDWFRERTCLVGSYRPNVLGLYDLHGNVYEWCNDWFSEGYYEEGPRQNPPGPSSGTCRVMRGGGWYCGGLYCRTAYRNRCDPAGRNNGLGFRVALVLDNE